MDNMALWNKINRPPKTALKAITGGRLRGKSDINPQWRYLAMTEINGPCGIGWKYEIVKMWAEESCDEQIFAFAEIKLYIKNGEAWSDPIPGVGGSMLVEAEKGGLHANDEGYKMAVTDALSVAMKMIGMAADIYLGRWDGSKYSKIEIKEKSSPETPFPDFKDILDRINKLKSQIVDLDGNDSAYWEALKLYGVENATEFKTRDAMIDFGKDLKAYIDKKGVPND